MSNWGSRGELRREEYARREGGCVGMMNLRVIDDYGDAGFGGHYAIEVSGDDEWHGDEHIGERVGAEREAARAFASYPTDGQPFVFSSKVKARKALAAARRVQRERPAECLPAWPS
jgi:hypothetical protein